MITIFNLCLLFQFCFLTIIITQSIYLEEIIIGNNSRLDKQARKVLFKVSSFLEK